MSLYPENGGKFDPLKLRETSFKDVFSRDYIFHLWQRAFPVTTGFFLWQRVFIHCDNCGNGFLLWNGFFSALNSNWGKRTWKRPNWLDNCTWLGISSERLACCGKGTCHGFQSTVGSATTEIRTLRELGLHWHIYSLYFAIPPSCTTLDVKSRTSAIPRDGNRSPASCKSQSGEL